MTDKTWNEKGESFLRGDGTFHHPESSEGKTVLRRVYGRNYENVEFNDSIYGEDGSFYID